LFGKSLTQQSDNQFYFCFHVFFFITHTPCVEKDRIYTTYLSNQWFTIFFPHKNHWAKKLTTLADARHVTKIQHEAKFLFSNVQHIISNSNSF
jgi:hypothetical protein